MKNKEIKEILCIGDLALDVLAKLDGFGLEQLNYGSDTPSQVSTYGGGAAANVASWLIKMDTQPTLIARVGDDSIGNALIHELEGSGVRCHKRVNPHLATGCVVVLVDSSGERTMLPDSGANAGLGLDDLPELVNFSAAYISGYALWNSNSHQGVLDIFKRLDQGKIPIIFDPASVGTMQKFSAGKREVILTSIPKSKVLVLNSAEAEFLSDEKEISKSLIFLARYAEIVIIKRGDNGAIARIGSKNQIFEVAAKSVKPLDTTGAGDSFAAGFIGQWVESGDVEAAIVEGNRLAGECVQIIGARPLSE
ncbi:MAG: carbohydrate kinase family protein [Actinomycetota bacterium]|nr:carbohydrate kinase family protein [Actinomycetota bacterium]